MSAHLLVTDGYETWETTVAEFLDDNAECDEICDAVRTLPDGEVLILGGGACPDMWVTRAGGPGAAARQRLGDFVKFGLRIENGSVDGFGGES